MERNFNYDVKETYSQKELDELLNQHKVFVSGGFKNTIDKAEFDELETKYNELKTQNESKTKLSIAKSLINDEKKALALVKLTKFDDDNFKDALTKSLEENTFLKETPKVQSIKGTEIVKETISTPKTYRFAPDIIK